jgi:hypothetical protein
MENPDQTRKVWKAARAHRDANPGPDHTITVDRMQRVWLEPCEGDLAERWPDEPDPPEHVTESDDAT